MSLLKRISVYGGIACWLPAIWQAIKYPIKRLFELGEHFEFAVNRTHDIEYVGPMLAYLLEPPSWFGAALILPASVLIWLGLRRSRVRVREGEADAPVKSKEIVSLTGAPIGNSEPIPDMSIRELFFHIHPEPFTDEPDKVSVGREVIEEFSIPRLSVWGQRLEGSKRLPLAAIDSQEWQRAKFTYWFLDEGNEQSLHVECSPLMPGVLPHQYANLNVNRSKVETIWRWVSLRDAAILVYEATQGMAIANMAEKTSTSPDDIIEYFASHLLGECRVYAKRVPSTKIYPDP